MPRITACSPKMEAGESLAECSRVWKREERLKPLDGRRGRVDQRSIGNKPLDLASLFHFAETKDIISKFDEELATRYQGTGDGCVGNMLGISRMPNRFASAANLARSTEFDMVDRDEVRRVREDWSQFKKDSSRPPSPSEDEFGVTLRRQPQLPIGPDFDVAQPFTPPVSQKHRNVSRAGNESFGINLVEGHTEILVVCPERLVQPKAQTGYNGPITAPNPAR
ncbi:unnamed protein product [Dibothriocephalus latus]|uniref:Uncharacterized protein n=1 Tax=Dibothriocephalus latus TaxID=60516 RepID=A0A3P7NJG9_DIBLA|nr:unnamed protein product [Dibothriocephalus latus]